MKKGSRKAYAKVNLMLNVVGKREDGYHLLQMINAKISLHDKIYLKKRKDKRIDVVFSNHYNPSNNIVKQVGIYMQNHYQIQEGMTIKIKKRIPIGSGLGGGSADVAAVIHLIDDLFELNLSLKEKEQIALQFGADIPYCLTDKKALVEGIGELITPIDFSLPYQILIVYPKIPVMTKKVFSYVTHFSKPIKSDELFFKLQKGQALKLMNNDLQPIVMKEYPKIKDLISYLNSVSSKKVMMSGSGSTIYMLLSAEKGNKTMKKIKKHYPNYDIALYNFK